MGTLTMSPQYYIITSWRNSLNDVYAYRDIIATKHPNNHNVNDKIRQILQYLRDMGLVKFVSPGHYKKLFRIKI